MPKLTKLLSSLKSSLAAFAAFGKLPAPIRGALKAVVAAVVPLVLLSLLDGKPFDLKAIETAAATALIVYLVPNIKTKTFLKTQAK